MSLALLVAPLLIRWLPRSLVLCFMANVENVKNIGGSLGGSLNHWLSVLWKMSKLLKISVAPSVATSIICSLFYGKCGKFGKCEKCRWLPWRLPCSLVLCFMGIVENVKNIGGSFGGSLVHWLYVL